MLITTQQKTSDPVYPIMQGNTPLATEFNKRSKELWEGGNLDRLENMDIQMILIEIFADEYNKRHAPRKAKK